MDEVKKDLKEEEKTSTGADQPEKETTKSDEGGEATGATGATGASGAESSDDEVKITKAELKQFQKDSKDIKNLRKAVKRLNKDRGRVLPGSEPEKKKKDVDDDIDDEKYVTKDQLDARDKKRDEKRAVNKACENEEIELNWFDVIEFYVAPKDNSYSSKLAAILKAHKAWRKENDITDETDEEKKLNEDKNNLSTDKGINKGKVKKQPSKKKHIIPRKKQMKDWF